MDENLKARFLRKISKTNSCWLWTAFVNHTGYGIIAVNGKTKRAHRLAWELYNNCFIPKNMLVLHKCDVRNCVNPSHLFLGTQQDNVNDMMIKGRQTVWNRKLTNENVIDIKILIENGARNIDIAAKFNIDPSIVSRIKRNKVYKI